MKRNSGMSSYHWSQDDLTACQLRKKVRRCHLHAACQAVQQRADSLFPLKRWQRSNRMSVSGGKDLESQNGIATTSTAFVTNTSGMRILYFVRPSTPTGHGRHWSQMPFLSSLWTPFHHRERLLPKQERNGQKRGGCWSLEVLRKTTTLMEVRRSWTMTISPLSLLDLLWWMVQLELHAQTNRFEIFCSHSSIRSNMSGKVLTGKFRRLKQDGGGDPVPWRRLTRSRFGGGGGRTTPVSSRWGRRLLSHLWEHTTTPCIWEF